MFAYVWDCVEVKLVLQWKKVINKFFKSLMSILFWRQRFANRGHSSTPTCFISLEAFASIWMILIRGWNCTYLIYKSIGFSSDRWLSHHISARFQSQPLIVGIGFLVWGALGSCRACFLLLFKARPWPSNTHYCHDPSSSCCVAALGRHTNRSEAHKHAGSK